MRKFLTAAVLAAGMLASGTAGLHAQDAKDATANDNARFLAGLAAPDDSPNAKLMKNPGWQGHAKFFNTAWERLDKQQLSRVRSWSDKYVTNPKDTLFYFFSGPDFLYAHSFFPKAKTYILAGLEPVGPIPQVSEATLRTLPQIRSSLDNTIRLSFFVTRDMNEKLRGNTVRGALPILYVFLSRAGVTLQDVKLIALDENGEEQPIENSKGRSAASGVKIVFQQGSNAPQTLYYFSTDLSNSGVAKSGFLKFAEKFGQGDGLVKSASYLLHGDNFSRVRNFLLTNVRTMVQDDTGVPLAFLKREDWELYPFGVYIGPIEVFSNAPQKLMRDLFSKNNNPPKLDFGIGYRWRGHDSNLLLAVRKDRKAGQ